MANEPIREQAGADETNAQPTGDRFGEALASRRGANWSGLGGSSAEDTGTGQDDPSPDAGTGTPGHHASELDEQTEGGDDLTAPTEDDDPTAASDEDEDEDEDEAEDDGETSTSRGERAGGEGSTVSNPASDPASDAIGSVQRPPADS